MVWYYHLLKNFPKFVVIHTRAGGLIFHCCIFLLFHAVHGVLRQEYWGGLQFPPPVDHALSELFPMTHPSSVALPTVAHSFIKLHKSLHHDKAVIHEVGISSDEFSHSVVSNSLRPHGLQHARLPCPSPTPGACSDSTFIKSVMPSNHLILSPPLLLLPSILPSIRVFSSESALRIRWPKYWSLSFNISLSSEYSGLISFRIDWLDLLAVQGTLKSLLQHHSSKASILRCSAFFIVQLSHGWTGKTIALTRRTFVGK